MKELFISVFLTITTFFGINKENIISEAVPTIISEPTIINETIKPTLIATPSIIIKKITPIPTISTPKNILNEEVLRNFFGFTETNHINLVLSEPDQVRKYEVEYRNMMNKFPIKRLVIKSPNQKFLLPRRDDQSILCNGTQLNEVYKDLTLLEADYEYKRMDYECHHGRGNLKETKECQEWRRINDGNKNGTEHNTPESIDTFIRNYSQIKNKFSDLLDKYCK